ncbi:unnamed protein product [Bursaphelenchus okinawaensis]|uniref:Uncharacterized protein n=1 Tax=Bursaphelenchus okinawaensis TaxID=465554 RepID=A0A811L801_9BILA|nr:unnamed protein product [Bursaphelenchus okinawaensis]CAG9118401.1 unnamed protein product [Bursaphelenchus okinawaensis]
MVILRTERVFCQTAKTKFSECYLMISFDSTGPSFTLYKDNTAKKQLLQTIDLKKAAQNIRFGTTCRPYGNLPIFKKDNRLDTDNFMVFQVEVIVKKNHQPKLVWLCAESAKQMFGILKIFATCLTYLNIPPPPRNPDVNDPNSLAKYKPHLLTPANNWERFWENPPPAKLLSALELARALTKSLEAINQTPEISNKSKTVSSTSKVAVKPIDQRRRSSSTTSTANSRSISNHYIPIHSLRRASELPKHPLTIVRPHKYEKNETPSPPLLRQKTTLQKKIPDGRVEVLPLKTASEALVAPQKALPVSPEPNYIYYVPKHCHCYDHTAYNGQTSEHDKPKRPLSTYSSAYGSAPQTPSHLQPKQPILNNTDLLRRMSELSLRPIGKRPRYNKYDDIYEEINLKTDSDLYHTKYDKKAPLAIPTEHENNRSTQYEPTTEVPYNVRRYSEQERQVSLPHEESDDIEISISETEQRCVIMISRGIQTQHDLPHPPIPLVDDYGYAQVKRYSPVQNVRDGNYSRMSMASLRSIYLRHLETDDYATEDPLLVQYDQPLLDKAENSHLRSYTVEITQAHEL